MSAGAAILQAFGEAAPWSWGVAALALAAFLWAAIATIAQFARSERRPSLRAFLGPLLLLAGLVGVALHGVARGRSMMANPGADQPELVASNLAGGVSMQMNLIAMLLELGLPVLATIAFGAVVPPIAASAREKRPWSPPLLVGGALVAPLICASLALLRYVLALIHGFAGLAGVDPAMKPPLMVTLLNESLGLLDHAHAELAVIGVVVLAAAVAGAAIAARSGQRAGRAQLAGAGLLFFAGVVAFAATRGQAEDARHVLPANGDNVLSPADRELAPRSTRCTKSASRAPVLAFGPDAAMLFDRPVEPEDFGEQILTLRINFRLLHPDQEFPGQIAVVAPRETPLERMEPFLYQALVRGYPNAQLVVVHPGSVETRTLGHLDRPFDCGLELQLDDQAPFTSKRTWGELLTALEDGAPIRFLPRPAR